MATALRMALGATQCPQRHGAGAIIMRWHAGFGDIRAIFMAAHAICAAGALPVLIMGPAAARGRGNGGGSGRLEFSVSNHYQS